MTKRKPKDLPGLINWLQTEKPDQVAAMRERINSALKERAFYEREKSPNGSHVELRRTVSAFLHNNSAAAFFLVCGADPDLVFNRERKAGTRANLKGFRKVRQLIDYITGKSHAFETVSKALFACSIVASYKGINWLASPEQELILSPEELGSLPEDIRNDIYSFQHKHMTIEGDSRNQACQFRTTFENLNMFIQLRDEFDGNEYTLGISVIPNHPVIEYLATRWNLKQYKKESDNVGSIQPC